jgi:hypothetical protein
MDIKIISIRVTVLKNQTFILNSEVLNYGVDYSDTCGGDSKCYLDSCLVDKKIETPKISKIFSV